MLSITKEICYEWSCGLKRKHLASAAVGLYDFNRVASWLYRRIENAKQRKQMDREAFNRRLEELKQMHEREKAMLNGNSLLLMQERGKHNNKKSYCDYLKYGIYYKKQRACFL